jgi:hypothetical protein
VRLRRCGTRSLISLVGSTKQPGHGGDGCSIAPEIGRQSALDAPRRVISAGPSNPALSFMRLLAAPAGFQGRQAADHDMRPALR